MPGRRARPAAVRPCRRALAAAGESEARQAEPVAEEHEKSRQEQQCADEQLCPASDEPLHGEGAASASQQCDAGRAEQRVGEDASCGVEQSVDEDSAAVAHLACEVSHGGDVGGQRAGAYGREQAEQQGRQRRYGRTVEQVLQCLHGVIGRAVVRFEPSAPDGRGRRRCVRGQRRSG